MTPETLPPTDAAIQLGESYARVLAMISRGVLKGGKRDGKWFVDAKDLRRLKAERAAESSQVPASPLPSRFNDIAETCSRLHVLGMQREVQLRALRADLIEAEHLGDQERADLLRDMVLAGETAKYHWDGASESWVIETAFGFVGARAPEQAPA